MVGVRGRRAAYALLLPGLLGPALLATGGPADASAVGHPLGGKAALHALGSRLPGAARLNGTSPAGLSALLRSDPSARIGAGDHLLYVDDERPSTGRDAAPAGAAALAAPSVDTGGMDAFALHSDPGNPHKIFLDVDGVDLRGSAWNNSVMPDGPQVGLDSDGDPTSFSPAERAVIASVWQRVAEDYSTLSVDVTTEDPGEDGLVRSGPGDDAYGQRLVVSGSPQAWAATCGSRCGGVSYVGVFGAARYDVSWVFTGGVSATNAKYIAEAASHELGHSLGLSHDGTSTQGYYGGAGPWAPIMGVGYYKALTQFSRGEYPGANNREDDWAVMARHGLALRPAPVQILGTSSWTAAGVVPPGGYAEYTWATGCAGPATITATPAAVSPDLDVKLTVLTSSGAVVATADTPSSGVNDTITGLDASLTRTLAPGEYRLRVSGTGAGSVLRGGYSAYGSAGTFRVTTSSCSATPSLPSAPGVTATVQPAVHGATVSWTAPANVGGSAVINYVVTRSDAGGSESVTVAGGVRSEAFTGLPVGVPQTLTVQAVNAVGSGPTTARTVSLSLPGSPPVGATRRNASALVTWGAAPAGSAPVTGYTVRRYDGASTSPSTTTVVSGAARSLLVTGLTNGAGYSFDVIATSSLGSGAPSAHTATVVPATIPGAPVGAVPAAGDAGGPVTASVSWSAPAQDGGTPVTGYVVRAWRLNAAGAVVGTTMSAVQPGTTQSLTMVLPALADYRFSVQALNAVGRSDFSLATDRIAGR